MSGIPADRMDTVGQSLASPKRGQALHPSPYDPVVFPGLTIASMTDRVTSLATRERAFLWWYIALTPCALAAAWLMVSLVYLFIYGIGVLGNNWPVMWGFPILSYVWW